MNERIQQLAEQAGYTPLPGFDFANNLQEVFLKKFAELIVRECMEVAHPKLTDVGEWAAGMRLVQKRLKQRFGVN